MRTILVVEDEPQIAGIVRDYLEHAGFAVIAAGDGAAALALVRARRIPAQPTHFEVVTAAAVVHFARKRVDAAVLEVGPDQTRELRVLVTVPKADDAPSRTIRFRLTDIVSGATASTDDFFK